MQAHGVCNSDSALKYTAASYQQVVDLVVEDADNALTIELLERLVVSYLVGNGDHHLKNIRFLHGPVFKLMPCYDIIARISHGGIKRSG